MFIFCCQHALAQKSEENTDDEITVFVEVKGIGATEMPALIHGKDVLVPINLIFDFLKVRNIPSTHFDSLAGFYLNQQDVYLIDKPNNRIKYHDTVTMLKPGELVAADNNLYLSLRYLKSIFSIDGEFNFRRLSVVLTAGVELPAMREARLEQMRKNINRLRGDVLADTVVPRSNPNFHFGMADWALMSTQQSIGSAETRANLGLGAVLAGGEANASLNYSTLYKFDEKQQYYLWRYVDNDNQALRQIMAGKIFTQSIATLYAPVVGVQLTNAPTTYRKAYGTYTISNTTEPGWVVELYVNNVLVDYKKADAAGFYAFDVPLIYGLSIVKLRFYGPYGEERTSQLYINVPFNFLPVHEYEYIAAVGMVEDGHGTVFSRGGLHYGVSRSFTVGGGAEYLSSITSGTTIPFADASLKLTQRLLLSGEYDHEVRGKADLSYRFPFNLQLDLDYIKYKPGQTAIYYNYLEERKVVASVPLHTSFMSLFSRFTLDEITVPGTKYTNAELTFTGTLRSLGVNFSNYVSFAGNMSPYFYGLGSVSWLAPHKINFTTQLQFDYKTSTPEFLKFTVEKHLLGAGFLNASYQQFFKNLSESYNNNYHNFLVGFRYDFRFMRVAVSALQDNQGGYSRVESASGSFIFDRKSGYANANNRTNVGKAGITLQPFLDLNCNGRRDPGEPGAAGLKLHINGGRVIYNDSDTLIRILDLDPYVYYYIDLSKTSFDNIAWQIKNHIIKISVTGNNLTLLQIPVAVVGEVSGTVSLAGRGSARKGERQMIVNIYNGDSVCVAKTLTESDGFFNYTGLAPGDYFAVVDTGQLAKLHFRSRTGALPIHIAQKIDGDIVDGLEFVLENTRPDTAAQGALAQPDLAQQAGPTAENARPDTAGQGVETQPATSHKVGATRNSALSIDTLAKPQERDTAEIAVIGTTTVKHGRVAGDSLLVPKGAILADKGTYTIQVCAVRSEADARRIQARLMKKLHLPVAIVHRGHYYKPRIIGFGRRKGKASNYLPALEKKGVHKSLVVKLLYPIYGD